MTTDALDVEQTPPHSAAKYQHYFAITNLVVAYGSASFAQGLAIYGTVEGRYDELEKDRAKALAELIDYVTRVTLLHDCEASEC